MKKSFYVIKNVIVLIRTGFYFVGRQVLLLESVSLYTNIMKSAMDMKQVKVFLFYVRYSFAQEPN